MHTLESRETRRVVEPCPVAGMAVLLCRSAGARRSLQGLLAAAEPLQMPLRCLRPKGASGCARVAALGGGGRATLSAAHAAAIATYGEAIDFGRFLALKLRVVTISKKNCRSEN